MLWADPNMSLYGRTMLKIKMIMTGLRERITIQFVHDHPMYIVCSGSSLSFIILYSHHSSCSNWWIVNFTPTNCSSLIGHLLTYQEEPISTFHVAVPLKIVTPYYSHVLTAVLFPGFYSWRSTTNGSWFVQALCKELKDKGTSVHILTLLTFVIQRVALDFESNTPGNYIMHQQKQIPCVTTMLTRLLHFTRN
jgi:hypothetical protein